MGIKSVPAKQRMIEAALDLFHRSGVNGTSVDQILAKSKTGKSQFTHYFKNKDGLIRAAVQYLDALVRGGTTPSRYEFKTWKDFDRWLKSYIDFQKSIRFERSCPFGTLGADLSKDQEPIREEIRLFLDWGRAQMARFFAEKKAAGEMAAATKPEELADLCIAVMQGGMLLTKMTRDPEMFENAAHQVGAYVRLLRTRASKAL